MTGQLMPGGYDGENTPRRDAWFPNSGGGTQRKKTGLFGCLFSAAALPAVALALAFALIVAGCASAAVPRLAHIDPSPSPTALGSETGPAGNTPAPVLTPSSPPPGVDGPTPVEAPPAGPVRTSVGAP